MHPHPAPKRRGAHGSGARGSGQLQTSVSHASETRIRLPCLTLRPNAQKKTPSRRRLPRHVAAAPHVRPSSETAGTRAARQTTSPHLYTLMQASGSGAPPALSTSRAGMLPCPPRRGDASSSSAGRLESGGRPAGRGRERQYLPSPRHMHIARRICTAPGPRAATWRGSRARGAWGTWGGGTCMCMDLKPRLAATSM